MNETEVLASVQDEGKVSVEIKVLKRNMELNNANMMQEITSK